MLVVYVDEVSLMVYCHSASSDISTRSHFPGSLLSFEKIWFKLDRNSFSFPLCSSVILHDVIYIPSGTSLSSSDFYEV